jgi:hypothetical protein
MQLLQTFETEHNKRLGQVAILGERRLLLIDGEKPIKTELWFAGSFDIGFSDIITAKIPIQENGFTVDHLTQFKVDMDKTLGWRIRCALYYPERMSQCNDWVCLENGKWYHRKHGFADHPPFEVQL